MDELVLEEYKQWKRGNRKRGEEMAKTVMNTIQYEKCGGGPAGLKVNQCLLFLFLLIKHSYCCLIQGLCCNQHVEVAVPSPKTNEVLLKVEAVSINPIDWKIQKGLLRPLFFPGNFPHTPCMHLFSSHPTLHLPFSYLPSTICCFQAPMSQARWLRSDHKSKISKSETKSLLNSTLE